jgi:hypothetical protein
MRNAEIVGAKNEMNRIVVYLILLTSLFLVGADKGGPERGEQAALREQRRALHQRVENLKREQDYLLFQKTMYESDSKYLVIDIREKTGHLKYKNRVLKDFPFQTSKNFPRRSLKPGMLTLTEKIEGKKDRHALVFGKTFVVRWKRSAVPREQSNIPSLSLSRKDLLSLYYAVEDGALAYVVR